jgi:hypothetical protein
VFDILGNPMQENAVEPGDIPIYLPGASAGLVERALP